MAALIGFWRATFLLPRIALVLVALAAVANLGSYAGLAMRGRFEFLIFLPISAILLSFATVLTVGLSHAESIRPGRDYGTVITAPATRIPSVLRWALPLSLGYLLAVFILLTAPGEGSAVIRDGQEVWVIRDVVVRTLPSGTVALRAARELRLFSAVTMFFGLAITVFTHRSLARRLGTQTAANRVAV